MRRRTAPSQTTDAFVLRTRDFGEANRVVHFLSPEVGRLDAVAHSARRARGRFGGSLELLSWGRLTYRAPPGRDLVTIERFELVRSVFELLSIPEGLSGFSHLAELAEAVAVPEEDHGKLVRLLTACIDAFAPPRKETVDPVAPLEIGEDALERLCAYFDLWVARIEGFWPSLSHCGACERHLTEAFRVGIHTGGALCARCARAHHEPNLPLGGAAAAAAARALAVGPRAFVETPFAAGAIRELRRVAAALLTVHLDRELRTMRAPGIVRLERR